MCFRVSEGFIYQHLNFRYIFDFGCLYYISCYERVICYKNSILTYIHRPKQLNNHYYEQFYYTKKVNRNEELLWTSIHYSCVAAIKTGKDNHGGKVCKKQVSDIVNDSLIILSSAFTWFTTNNWLSYYMTYNSNNFILMIIVNSWNLKLISLLGYV